MHEAAAGSQLDIVEVTEAYYDSTEADRFYHRIWGGEDIHIGIYQPGDDIARASRRTVETMASMVPALGPQHRVADLGAGYGGSARFLSRQRGCHVACVNLSETQNARNRQLTEAAGLSDRIEIVHGNFEALPIADDDVDLVWSQDAFLHSEARRRVLTEARRVLKAGGELIFTDPMQADDCPEGALEHVLQRIHLESLASFGFYRREAESLGFEPVAVHDHTEQLGRHYRRVHEELSSRYAEMIELSSREYVDRMLAGLSHWVEAAGRGHLAWGILHFRAA